MCVYTQNPKFIELAKIIYMKKKKREKLGFILRV